MKSSSARGEKMWTAISEIREKGLMAWAEKWVLALSLAAFLGLLTLSPTEAREDLEEEIRQVFFPYLQISRDLPG